MNRLSYLSLSGVLMIVAGAIIIFSETIGVGTSKVLVPLSLVLSGIYALLFSKANAQHKIAKQFHFLQGVGMITFAAIITFLAKDLQGLLQIISFFLLVYGLFELIFAFSVLSSNFKINMSILMTRLVTGGVTLVGAFILFMSMLDDLNQGLMIAGILIAIGGLGFLIFSRKISKQ